MPQAARHATMEEKKRRSDCRASSRESREKGRKWDGAGELVNGIMDVNYKNQIKKLAKKDINLAFVPFDPKLGMYQSLGMEYFLEHTNAEYVFPMHMWQDYSGIQPFIK